VNGETDLIDLRVFCSVARRSSFVAAATDLGISPAYVSKRIAALETQLGVTLFHRTTRRVSISDEGELAYGWARKILENVEGMVQAVAGRKGAPAGSLRISASVRLGSHHVSHALSLLQKKYPALQIWLELVDRRVDLIAEGIDIDIRVGEVAEPHLVAQRIAESSRVLCAAPAYLQARGVPKVLADLAQHECLLFRDREQAFGTWRLQGPKGLESIKVTGAVGSNQSDVIRNWALAGHGITMLSIWDVAPQLKQGSLVRVLPAYAQPADVWAVTAARPSESAKLEVCVEFLVEQLTRGPHALVTDPR